MLVGAASDRVGLSGAIASTGLVYVVSAALAGLAARALNRRNRPLDNAATLED